MTLKKAFYESKYSSIKQDSYFPVYERILEKYRNEKITLVEVGVLDGGSLFMWRKYLGAQANIVGIDFNPAAKKWEAFGFPIFIGDQGSEDFWNETLPKIGSIDVFIDDGGHTNQQQIVTVVKATPYVNNGGIIVVEDTHASYMEEFGNPSPFSFMAFTKHLMDRIHARYGGESNAPGPFPKKIHSIEIFESIIVFNIDQRLCLVSKLLRNEGESKRTPDYRYKDNIIAKLRYRSLKKGLKGFYYRHKLRREYNKQNKFLKKYFDWPDL